MDILLYNTLSGKKEPFVPLKAGAVGMYHCGPTVYDDAHIGNLRSYVFADTLRRAFEYNGYAVKQIVNITDVGHLTSDADEGEDKMTKALKRLGKPLDLESMKEVAGIYEGHFVRDLGLLNIETPTSLPRASEHVQKDIELIEALEGKGFVYKAGDGIYFDTGRFPGYGALGKPRGQSADGKAEDGKARVVNPEKRHPADFAVWKSDPKLGWESPWGKGFPGWHIECSAMSREYLGQPFDIHTGGVDHIPVHHNNEIAQSEAAYGEPLARYWMHNAFLTMNAGKMAKSAGGAITLGALAENGIDPLSYRYWLMTGHYRSPMDFSYDAVKAAQNAYRRLLEAVAGYPEGGSAVESARKRFAEAIGNDLDMPAAIALAWEVVKDKAIPDADKRATLLDFDRVLGLKLGTAPRSAGDVPSEVTALAEERERARAAKDWKKADELRAEIEARGFEVKDAGTGFSLVPKR
ncbi:MAG: cysteine--tRNA ligase [Patescibacteria group bacterium]|nr:cysteine--tRNA ligase [Patescibacteria group bacterium]